MAETTMKAAKKGFGVVRVEGLAGLEQLLNSTEGKVQSWQRVGEGATFIVVIEGVVPTYPVPEPEPEPVPEPVEAEAEKADEGNGRRRKSA